MIGAVGKNLDFQIAVTNIHGRRICFLGRSGEQTIFREVANSFLCMLPASTPHSAYTVFECLLEIPGKNGSYNMFLNSFFASSVFTKPKHMSRNPENFAES